MSTLRAMPVLQVRDVALAAAFYERLGFDGAGSWDHDGEPVFAILQRGDVTLAVQRAESDRMPGGALAAYVYVTDATALHDEFAALELPHLGEVRHDNPYGCVDFDVRDPDDNIICFGHDLDPVPGPGLGPTRGRG